MRWPLMFFAIVCSIGMITETARAEWQAEGVEISTAPENQQAVSIISDGAGGAIMCWIDERTWDEQGGYRDIYVQRVSAAGFALWTPDGVALCTAVFNLLYGLGT